MIEALQVKEGLWHRFGRSLSFQDIGPNDR